MIDLGYYSLLASMITCAWGFAAALVGAGTGSRPLIASARRSVHANFVLLLLASLSLFWLILSDNFTVRYVASYSSRDLPLLYKLSSFWGGQEGSLLFWALCISLFAFFAFLGGREHSPRFAAFFSASLLGIMAFFSSMLFFTGNPFELLGTQAFDGQGLNPLLQNWYMVIHPPTLFLGYAGIAVPFSLALAALADGLQDNSWLRRAAVWSSVAWIFLTAGITLGGRWAYEELGWGGYWAWDPVENASLLPWLVLTGFLHSLFLYRWQNRLKLWSFLLIVATFALTIFGTFITRSGVLSSVHAFGNSSIGPFLLYFIALSTLAALGLLLLRRKQLRLQSGAQTLCSRYGAMIMNNWVLTVLTLAILVGTIFPAVSEYFSGRKVAVDSSFYNQVSWPLGLAILLLVGACTILSWRNSSWREVSPIFVISLVLSTGAAGLILVYGIRQIIALAFSWAAVFVLSAIAGKLVREIVRLRTESGTGPLRASWELLTRRNLMVTSSLVHAGLVLVLLGIVSSSLFTREETFMLREGDSFEMEDYTLTFSGIEETRDPVKDMVVATVEVARKGKVTAVLTPRKDFHRNFEQPMTEIALEQSFLQDLYLILYGWDGEGNFSFRVIINPLIGFIWWGVVLMCAAVIWRLAFIAATENRHSGNSSAESAGRGVRQ